jgi:hypothetical protein
MVRGELSGWISAARMIEASACISCLIIPTFTDKCLLILITDTVQSTSYRFDQL